MDSLLREIDTRIKFLEKITSTIKKHNLQDPDSFIFTKKRGDKEYYYKRSKSTDNRDVSYIRKSEINTAKKIAQYEYETEYYKYASKELNKLKATRESLLKLNKHYNKISNQHPSLITPLTLSNTEYAKKWESKQYKPSPIPIKPGQGFKTDKGDIVRSKSELIIANTLYARHIPYRYEDKLTLGGKYYRPDFKVLNVRTREEIIWEHFGMLDNINYVSNNLDRLDDYIQNGYSVGKKLIISHESEKHPLSMVEINNLINDFCV